MVNIFVPAQTVIVAIKIFSHRLHLFCKKKKVLHDWTEIIHNDSICKFIIT